MTLFRTSLIGSLVLLSSCSFLGFGNDDFSSLYSEHIDARIDSIDSLGNKLGYMDSYTADGSLRLMASIPAILSGAVIADYTAEVAGRDGNFSLEKLQAGYETLLASGSLQASKLGLISKGGNAYFQYSGLMTSLGLIDPEVSEVLAKYSDTWLALTDEEIAYSLSGASEEEIFSYKLTDAFASLTLTDARDYLKKYPLFTETKNLGKSGSLMMFEVAISRENIAGFMEEFTQKALGQPITEEMRTELVASMQTLSLTGVMGFDQKHPENFEFRGALDMGNGETLSIVAHQDDVSWKMELRTDIEDGLTISGMEKEKGYSIKMSIIAGGAEVALIEGAIERQDKSFLITGLFEAPSQGLSVTLEHTRFDDGNFDGKMNAGIAAISWKGQTSKENGLEKLDMNAAMMGANLTLDLSERGADGLLRGPLELVSGDATVFSATVGLQASKKVFHLILDIMSPEDPSLVSKAEIYVSTNRQDARVNIEAPKETISFQEFADALSFVMPAPELYPSDEMMGEDMLLSDPMYGNPGIEEIQSIDTNN